MAGIPSSVTLDTNVPATVFYTLNGAEPTVESSVAVGPIETPTNSGQVILKAFATDGVDTSPTITQEWITNVAPARHPHDKVTVRDDNCNKATYPFGSSAQASGVPPIFGNTAGQIVDDNMQPRVSTAGDGMDGYGAFVTPPVEQYDFRFSETDAVGQTGRGIGTLPGRVLSSAPRNDNDHPTSTTAESPLFDAKAMVIFQDSREDPFDPDVPKINRPYFDLEDQSKARDGRLLTAIDPVTPQGNFIKAHYNPTENTLTYYYYDNRVHRWIISKEPYHPSQNPTVNMSGIVSRSSRGEGVGKIYKWIPFQYRRLI